MSSAGGDAHTLAGAYAMDAVSGTDRARFEQHLAGCGICRDEIRELREATARLAAAAAVAPRPELKAMAMLAAAQTRQLPPLTAAAAEPAGPSAVGLGPGAGPGGPRPAHHPGRRRRRVRGPRRRLPLLPAAAAAVLVAVIVVVAVLAGRAQHRLAAAQGKSMAITRVLAATDAATMKSRVRTGGTATVVMSHAQGKLVFTAAGLQTLPASRRYELWLMSPARARPACCDHSAGRDGHADSGVRRRGGRPHRDDCGAGGGTAQPTLPAVMLLSLRVGR